MRVVLIDSPGRGPEPHWSSGFCDRLANRLQGDGGDVLRLHASPGAPAPLHRVARSFTDVPEEVVLTKALRTAPAPVVVHVGVGGRGSSNMLWIAERLGSAGVGVVRTAEVVCQRGDLVDRDDNPCATYDDPERCAWCCRGSFFQRARPTDFLNRLDLVVAGLQASDAVWTADGDDAAVLEAVGVPRRVLRSAPADDLVAAVAADLPAIARAAIAAGSTADPTA